MTTIPTLAELREAWPMGCTPKHDPTHCYDCALAAALDLADALAVENAALLDLTTVRELREQCTELQAEIARRDKRDDEDEFCSVEQPCGARIALARENAELKRCRTIADEHLHADTERLDWLSVVRAGSWYPFANEQGEWWIVHHDAKLSVGPEPTLRAAIDSAMAKEKP